MRTVSFGPSTRKLLVPADTAFSKISMLQNGIIFSSLLFIHSGCVEQIDIIHSFCGMLLSAIHEEEGEEKLHLLMVDDHIPAGAKLY